MDVPPAEKKIIESRFRQYLAVIVVNMTALSYGVVLGWCSPVLPLLQSADNPVGREPMSESSASWLGSLMCLGALAATPAYGYLCKRRSRKLVGYVIGAIGTAGWIMTLFANSEAALFSARVVLGFVASGSCIICMLYIVETVDDDIRGAMGSMINLFICTGVLFSYVIGSYVTYLTFNILSLAVMVSFVLAFWWMPETPAYLDSIGEHLEAEKSRKWLRLKAKSPVKEAIVLEKSNDVSANEKSFLAELLSNRGIRKAMVIGIGLVLNNQLSGITAVVSYTVTIFQASGNDMSPNISAILVGALQLSAVYLTSFVIDRAGRKVLLLGSNVTITVCLTSLGIFFHLKSHDYDVSSLGWVPVVSLCVFVMAFAMGSGTIALIVIGEIFPPRVKDVAVTFCICFLNFMGFLVAKFFMTLIQVLGMSGCFWFFAACCLASVFFCQFVVPETKNRSIDSILAELNGEEMSEVKLQKARMV